jgi:hypothetical protein
MEPLSSSKTPLTGGETPFATSKTPLASSQRPLAGSPAKNPKTRIQSEVLVVKKLIQSLGWIAVASLWILRTGQKQRQGKSNDRVSEDIETVTLTRSCVFAPSPATRSHACAGGPTQFGRPLPVRLPCTPTVVRFVGVTGVEGCNRCAFEPGLEVGPDSIRRVT